MTIIKPRKKDPRPGVPSASPSTNQLKTKASDSQNSELLQSGWVDRCVHSGA